MTTVYLCGPINGCTDSECKDWREQAKESLVGFKFLDPMRRDYRGVEGDCTAEIVEGDKEDIDNSDILLVFAPKPSVGTSMEIIYAWERKKTIITVVPEGSPVSPWLKYHSSHLVSSMNEAFSLFRTFGLLNDWCPKCSEKLEKSGNDFFCTCCGWVSGLN